MNTVSIINLCILIFLCGLVVGWCARSLYGLWRKQRLPRPISREEQERFLQDWERHYLKPHPWAECQNPNCGAVISLTPTEETCRRCGHYLMEDNHE
jgi:hypothetical protein